MALVWPWLLSIDGVQSRGASPSGWALIPPLLLAHRYCAPLGGLTERSKSSEPARYRLCVFLCRGLRCAPGKLFEWYTFWHSRPIPLVCPMQAWGIDPVSRLPSRHHFTSSGVVRRRALPGDQPFSHTHSGVISPIQALLSRCCDSLSPASSHRPPATFITRCGGPGSLSPLTR